MVNSDYIALVKKTETSNQMGRQHKHSGRQTLNEKARERWKQLRENFIQEWMDED